MTQTQAILNWLEKAPITPQEALQHIGCMRLASRIDELRKKGFVIVTEMVQQNGKEHARYHLSKETRHGTHR